MRTPSQPIRLVDQQINPLSTLQHPLDILRHDPPHIINIAFRHCERVRRRRRVERLHKRAELRVEPRTAIRRQRSEIGTRRGIGREELAFYFEEKGEGNAAALFGGCHDDVSQRIVRGGFVVVGIIAFACGRVRNAVHE